ncbi:hypothetical protein MESS4_370002 [Mesorhizobium sp. STM 4661]|nr:hypothetical protein MESS4_370002 [Mesorhizobium sp. STM 4661]
MGVVMRIGPAEQMHRPPEIDVAFGSDILEHFGFEQAVDDFIGGRARRVDHPGDIADAHRRPVLQQGLEQHDDAVDAAPPFAIARLRAGFHFDSTHGAIAHASRTRAKIISVLVSRRLKDVKAESSIQFVRYTDTLSEISDTNEPGAEGPDERTDGFRDAATGGFSRPEPARPDTTTEGEQS